MVRHIGDHIRLFNDRNDLRLAPALLTIVYFYADGRPLKTHFNR